MGPVSSIRTPFGGSFLRYRNHCASLEDISRAASAMKRKHESVEQGLDYIVSKVATATKLLAVEREFDGQSAQLSTLLGPVFRAYDTDWDDVVGRLKWTNGLIEMGPGEISAALSEQAERPAPASEYEASARTLTSDFQTLISQHFDEQLSDWSTWLSAPFDGLEEWIEYLIRYSDEVADLLDYRTACMRIDELFGDGTVSKIRAATDDASLIPSVLQRSIAISWLNAMQERVPIL